MAATFVRTADQRDLALIQANVVRIGICDKRKELRALSPQDGYAAVAGLLEDPSDVVLSMRVGVLLLSVRKLGQVNASRLCSLAGVRSLDRRVRELSVRQRRVLAEGLRFKARSRR